MRAPLRALADVVTAVIAATAVLLAPAVDGARPNAFALGPGAFVAGGGRQTSPDSSFSIFGAVQFAPSGRTDPAARRVYPQLVTLALGASKIHDVTVETPAPFGNTLPVSASVSDNILGAADVELHYRKGGETSFTILPMPGGPGSVVHGATIPGGQVGERGLEIYITARTGGFALSTPETGSFAQPLPVAVALDDFEADGALATEDSVYRMISFAASMAPSMQGNADLVIGDDLGSQDSTTWRLFRWDESLSGDSKYREFTSSTPIDTLIPGRAFWLVTRDSSSIDFDGVSTVASSGALDVPLKPGWNQIGNPFAFAVDLDSVDIVLGGVAYSFAAAADSGFVEMSALNEYVNDDYGSTSRTLEPWTGYFVFNADPARRPMTWRIPSVASDAVGKARFVAPPARDENAVWQTTIEASNRSGSATRLEIGIAPRALGRLDRSDKLLPPSPSSAALEIGSSHSEIGGGGVWMRRDFRPVPAWAREEWDVVVSSKRREVVTLRFDALSAIPAGWSARIIDANADRTIDPLVEREYQLIATPGALYRLRFLVGPTDELDRVGAESISPPPVLTFDTITPNPARGPLIMRFGFPRAADVDLAVYDVNGRRVRELVAQPLPAGFHVLEWDGRTESGERAASGVYFARLYADHQSDVRKLTLFH